MYFDDSTSGAADHPQADNQFVPTSVGKLVADVRAANEDFEFYPTTDEIVSALVADINRDTDEYFSRDHTSVLDIGAGNGKVLLALAQRTKLCELHAIEKSTILLQQLPPEILIVGTEFAEQSLISKHVDIVFSNPPYSEFEAWATKIIREAACKVVYLVLPTRWERSIVIADALRFRETSCEVIGQFDFEEADRRARAKVHLLRITLRRHDRSRRHEGDDAFERFFQEQFADLIGKFSEEKEPEAEQKSRFSEIVVGPGYPESLVALYDADIAKVQRNFKAVATLDADLLREFNVSPASIMECLKTKLAGLRSCYWHELFDNLATVTGRLTSGSRKRLLEILQKHVHVDFTVSNVYAVLIWVIKNANLYIESQLIDTYDLMVAKCNVQMYKSNEKTWQEDGWRYTKEHRQNSHYALDYRIVTHRIGGISARGFGPFGGLELDERAALFVGDLLTIARNLGFDCESADSRLYHSARARWTAGKGEDFHCLERGGEPAVLFDVRAFKNGNLHLRLNQKFILALNVEHGRLKGWLRSREEAVEELDDPAAAQYFGSNKRLATNPTQLLIGIA